MKFTVVSVNEDNLIYAFCPSAILADCICNALQFKFYKAGLKFEVHSNPDA